MAVAKPKTAPKPGAAKKTAVKKGAEKKSVTKMTAADWRDDAIARWRALILEVAPAMIEERKWIKPSNPAGVAAWSLPGPAKAGGGLVATGEKYKGVAKITFAHGAHLPDPAGLFNAGLNGGTRRVIDLREGERVNARDFKALVKAAVAFNAAKASQTVSKKVPAKATPYAKTPAPKKTTGKSMGKDASYKDRLPKNENGIVMLAGGNPQIPKGDGDAPVQLYIANMPGWKSALGEKIDALIVKAVPKVNKAVKWNSPFYGVEGKGWFLSFHVLTKYVKITFFKGTSLDPMPPGATEKSGESRWLDVYETDTFDEKRFSAWVKQAAKSPGWNGT